ncbi:vesicle-associated protein 1-2-like [Papaver somniferum]|uniref:vesicle-associated protein 1-2-like n=1 Tax=Papaver somniferum TaxID=3469 RepID=UPI000E7044F4|nr:vesicle-associated protein 1-2-like [Papaver somniferum]
MEAPQAQEDVQCKDNLLIHSIVTTPTTWKQDITREMFNKESVKEFKLRMIYYAPANYLILPVVPDEGSESKSQEAGTCLFDSVARRIGVSGGGGSRIKQLYLGEETTSMSSLKAPLLPNYFFFF